MARALGAVIAVSGVVFLAAYYLLPVISLGPGASFTFAELTLASGDVGITVPALVAVSVGLAVVLRPHLGPGVAAASILTVPWLSRFAFVLADDPFDLNAGLIVITASTGLLSLAAVAALALAGSRLLAPAGRPTVPRITVPGAVAFVSGAAGLGATLGLGWYKLVDQSEGLIPVEPLPVELALGPLGNLLEVDTWAGRASWMGLLLAVAGLALASASRGPTRRAAGLVLVTLMVAEAIRRGVLPAEELVPPFLEDFAPGVYTVELLPVGLLVPLLGAAAGAWLLIRAPVAESSAGAEATVAVVDPVRPVADRGLPVDPGPGPPSDWPPTSDGVA